MKKGDLKKQSIIEKMAEYILLNGIQKVSLRILAKAIGTSDRMLMHYFKDKEELLTAVLTYISDSFLEILKANQTEKMPMQILIPFLYQAMKNEMIRPYIRLWLELAALAAHKEEPYYTIGREIYTSYINWIYLAIQVEKEEDKEHISAITLAIVEGFVFLDALDHDATILKAIEGLDKIICSKS